MAAGCLPWALQKPPVSVSVQGVVHHTQQGVLGSMELGPEQEGGGRGSERFHGLW